MIAALPVDSVYFWFVCFVLLVVVIGVLDEAAAHARLWWEGRR